MKANFTMMIQKEGLSVKNNKTARLQIRCTEEWYEYLKQKAKERGESVSDYVITCIALGQDSLHQEEMK